MQNDYFFFVLMTDIWAFNLRYDLNRVGSTNNTALTYYPIFIVIICFWFIFASSMNYVEIYITFIEHKKTLLMYQNSLYVYLEYFVLPNNVSRSKLKKISKRSSVPYVWVCYIVCSFWADKFNRNHMMFVYFCYQHNGWLKFSKNLFHKHCKETNKHSHFFQFIFLFIHR